jgi:hypothetical protein
MQSDILREDKMKINLKGIYLGFNSSYSDESPKIDFHLPIEYSVKMARRVLNEFPFRRFLKLVISRNNQHSKRIMEKFRNGYRLNFRKATIYRYNDYSVNCGMEIPFEKLQLHPVEENAQPEPKINWDDFESWLIDMKVGSGGDDRAMFEALIEQCGKLKMTPELASWYDNGNYRDDNNS